ncbi:MAG: SAM-dependent chlorinase/fluorinase [Nitrospira sp.]|nr:SAM-dependent chlorinase/fluorinase [Nitrospira sp.]
MPPPRPLITLLSDFGVRDWFVPSMKGVILRINPAVSIVDLSHDITPHRIEEAGFFLASCIRYFPEGTIHVAVVDPGVGTSRRPLLISTGVSFFIGPDNGLFSEILEQYPKAEVRKIDNRDYRLETAGSTFDGRDVFAPAAAWLSTGVPKELFGPVIHDPVRRFLVRPAWQEESLLGRIVCVDHFGNLISNLRREDVDAVEARSRRSGLLIRIGAWAIDGLVASYDEGSYEIPKALINSNGHVEVFLRERSAALHLRLGLGEEVRLLPRERSLPGSFLSDRSLAGERDRLEE